MNDGDGSGPDDDASETGRDGDVDAEDDGSIDADRSQPDQSEADQVAADDDAGDWEFSLDDIRQREADAAADVEAAERRRRPLEPGDPSLESVLFVLLGVVLTLFILSRLVVG